MLPSQQDRAPRAIVPWFSFDTEPRFVGRILWQQPAPEERINFSELRSRRQSLEKELPWDGCQSLSVTSNSPGSPSAAEEPCSQVAGNCNPARRQQVPRGPEQRARCHYLLLHPGGCQQPKSQMFLLVLLWLMLLTTQSTSRPAKYGH